MKPAVDAIHERGSCTTYVSLSYRYLRLGMVAMIGLIVASILVEFRATGWTCVQDSISAYYFTPVRLIFVGSWIAIGLCMIVLKGSNEKEDAFLNAAGLLAIVVALVPTPRTGDCSSEKPMNTTISVENIDNNILAYILVGFAVMAGSWVALYLAVPPDRRWPLPRRPWPERFRYALVPITIAVVVGVAFFWAFRAAFIEWAHPIATILLIALIVVMVFRNSQNVGDGVTTQPTTQPTRPSWKDRYFPRNLYGLIAWLMIGCAVVIPIVGLLLDWKYWRLTVEAVEVILFAAFWTRQTFDLQKSPLPRLDRAHRPTPITKAAWDVDATAHSGSA